MLTHTPTGLSPEEEHIAFNSTPDRQSLLGSHGQRPWVYLVLNMHFAEAGLAFSVRGSSSSLLFVFRLPVVKLLLDIEN